MMYFHLFTTTTYYGYRTEFLGACLAAAEIGECERTYVSVLESFNNDPEQASYLGEIVYEFFPEKKKKKKK